MAVNTRVLLRRQCAGIPLAEDFTVTEASVPSAGRGQLLCQTVYLSLDPYLRSKINARHMSGAVAPGELMAGEAVARVVEANVPEFAPGDYVIAPTGWQAFSALDATQCRRIDPQLGPLSAFLGVLGMPGLTAYAGLLRLGEPRAGDTLLVSAASGAVGSLVGQIAKIKGCRAVGIAGAPEKCAWARDVAGFDEVISYRDADLRSGLAVACPAGIDIYFDNVGGDTLQAAMEKLAVGARVVCCGLMDQYNAAEVPPGPNPLYLILARATMRGLVVYDHEDLRAEMERNVSQWLRDDKVAYLEDRTAGIENAPEAFARLMRGDNVGKALVVAADE